MTVSNEQFPTLYLSLFSHSNFSLYIYDCFCITAVFSPYKVPQTIYEMISIINIMIIIKQKRRSILITITVNLKAALSVIVLPFKMKNTFLIILTTVFNIKMASVSL